MSRPGLENDANPSNSVTKMVERQCNTRKSWCGASANSGPRLSSFQARKKAATHFFKFHAHAAISKLI